MSDTKNNKLAWRRLAAEFLPGEKTVTTLAFLVKSAYYKNLAYDISTHHITNVKLTAGEVLTKLQTSISENPRQRKFWRTSQLKAAIY